MFVKEGYWPGLQYPRVTGHEVAGISTRLARVSQRGRKANGWAWVGMAAIVVNAILAGVAISWGADISK